MYKDRGFIAITLLSDATDQSVAAAWANMFGITHPVLADTASYWTGYEADGYIPTFALLGPGAEVILRDPPFEELTAAAIEAALP